MRILQTYVYKLYAEMSICTAADEAQEAEAIQVLNAIYDMREHQPGSRPETMATIAHALAMLYFLLHELEKVRLVS